MKRLFPYAAIVVMVSGCPGVTGQDDPPADMPALAGRWALSGAGGRDAGCLVADASGDPVSLSGNPEVRRALDEDEIFFDGSVRPTTSALNYVGIGGATRTEDQVVLFIEIEVFQGVLSVGTQRLDLVGVLVDPATIVGTLESRQQATFASIPPLITEDGRAEHGGC